MAVPLLGSATSLSILKMSEIAGIEGILGSALLVNLKGELVFVLTESRIWGEYSWKS